MPYTLKPESVTRVQPILDALLNATEDVTFSDDAPHKLAYLIHNGIAAAANIPDFSQYADLAAKFKIRVRPGKVFCELRAQTITSIAPKMKFPGIDSVNSIVGTMLQQAKYSSEAYFPDAILDTRELEQVWLWAQASGYYIVNHEDAGITITKERTNLAWEPSEPLSP